MLDVSKFPSRSDAKLEVILFGPPKLTIHIERNLGNLNSNRRNSALSLGVTFDSKAALNNKLQRQFNPVFHISGIYIKLKLPFPI